MDQNDALNGQDTTAENNKEANTEELSMEALLETGELQLDLPRPGDVRQGIVASVSDDEVLVSIGAKSEGVIPAREISQLDEEDRAALEVGEEISVYVLSPEGRGGTMVLSIQRALEEEDWATAEKLMNEKDVYEGSIEGFNKGGLIVKMGRLRGFVPASQVGLSRRMSYKGDSPEQRWGNMVGDVIMVRVIEVDQQRRRLILSEKSALRESRETLKDRLLDELDIGDERTGRVTSLADFGAFVNINGADGLVHLSEISWDRIDHPSEQLEVGQEIQVKVISIDRDRKRIGLSIRQLANDPWEKYVEDYQVGQLIEGEITRLTKFGAFARIDENLEGLIHISELSDHRVEHPKEVLNVKDIVTLRIIKIDTNRRRIGLSLRKVESMKYSDLDWEMALAEIEEIDDEEEEAFAEEAVEETAEEPVEEEAEAPAETEEETEEPEEVEASVETIEEIEEQEEAEAPAETEEETEEQEEAEAPVETEEEPEAPEDEAAPAEEEEAEAEEVEEEAEADEEAEEPKEE